MLPHTRAMIAASAYALIARKKVAGLYDHAGARHLKIAAEAQGDHLQGFDGNRMARFGGTLPELYDAGDKVHVSIEIDGTIARGHDRRSATSYEVRVSEGVLQLYDHGQRAWFAFSVQTV